jgi:hypothetical protein
MLTATIQITFDANDPDKLAEFWAAAIGYTLQPPPVGFDSWDAFLTAHNIDWQPGQASAIVDREGNRPRIYFQRVPETKSAKNRVHLDINAVGRRDITADDRRALLETEAARIVGLGGRRVRFSEQDDEIWMVMADPEGDEFCIQ